MFIINDKIKLYNIVQVFVYFLMGVVSNIINIKAQLNILEAIELKPNFLEFAQLNIIFIDKSFYLFF